MSITSRRLIFAALVALSFVMLCSIMIAALSRNGISPAEWILFACFVITLPWTIIGFWNAFIGFVLMRTKENPAHYVFPAMETIDNEKPVTSSTAIAMCIRNEDVSQVYRNLNTMIARLVASGEVKNFSIYILSDTSEADTARQESREFLHLANLWREHIEITYRRREHNAGFKAGNIREFCDDWGRKHDYMLTLDADSVMSASAILRMVRLMQENPKIGIVQSLVVGLPSASAFTRAFQFGMRLGMRSYTLGGAWWQADCGPYWGHNALIRMKPFMEHCHLPILEGDGPLSGWILSHDQVEAVYMRRAGYECRVLADEGGSYEENPPHILEFIRRDLRWCHGNMQYFRLLGEKGLLLTSRVQLILAILMFIGSPAWMLFVTIATAGFIYPILNIEIQGQGPGYTLFAIVMTMVFAPKVASFLDVLLRPELRARFGGGWSVVGSWFSETVFSMMLAPIMAIANTMFLARLFLFRQAAGWVAQNRSVNALPLKAVVEHLWPQLMFGVIGLAAITISGYFATIGFWLALPVFVGPALVIPMAISSSHPFFGRVAARLGLWQIPEETTPPVVIRALDLPALTFQSDGNSKADHTPLTTEQLLRIDSEFETDGTMIPEPVRAVV